MAQRLNSIAYAMGFRDIEVDTVLVLAKWIKDYFGDVSMQEVASAFDLVTAKKIGTEISHYATFSQQYIGEVLSAFKTYRGVQIKLLKESQDNKRLDQPKGTSGQEMYEGMKRIALEKGEIMKVGDWTGAYKYAWKENLIHRMNEQEREHFKQQVIEALETEKRAKLIPESFNIDNSVQSECHKRILQAHFQQIIDGTRD